MAFTIYINPGTPIVFRPATVGSSGYNLNVANLAPGAGRLSARVDLGAANRPFLYEWRALLTLASATNVGENIILKLCTSDGTNADGGFVSSEQGITLFDSMRNMNFMGSLEIDNPQTITPLVGSGLVQIYSRYVQAAVWNATTASFDSTATGFRITLTPVPDYGA